MKIILFLTLSLIPKSLSQVDLSRLDSSTCGLIHLPDVIPNEWIDPIELVPPNPLPQAEESARIHQGIEADTRTMPWVVHIYSQRANNPNFRGTCSGSIISREWVFTAGHCMFYRNIVAHQYEWFGPTDHMIGAGPRNYIPNIQGFNFGIRSLSWFIPDDYIEQVAHANTFNTVPGIPNDIALIRLEEHLNPVYEADNRNFLINSICLPKPVLPPNPFLVYQVAGYGRLGLNENDQNLLMTYSSQIQANYSVCQTRGFVHLFDWLRNTYGDDRFHMMDVHRDNADDNRLVCTTPDQTHAKSCHGDSGGPLFNERTQPDQMGNTRYELTGVVYGGTGFSTLQNWFTWLRAYRDDGGLPDDEDIVALANEIYFFYRMHWPCDINSVFNVLNQYASWIDQTIRTNSDFAEATSAWLYYSFFFFAPLGILGTGGWVAYSVGLGRHQPEPPLRPPLVEQFQIQPPVIMPQVGQQVHQPQLVQQPPLDQP